MSNNRIVSPKEAEPHPSVVEDLIMNINLKLQAGERFIKVPLWASRLVGDMAEASGWKVGDDMYGGITFREP